MKNIAEEKDKADSGFIYDFKGFRISREIHIDGMTLGAVEDYWILNLTNDPANRMQDQPTILFGDTNINPNISYTYKIYSMDFNTDTLYSDHCQITVNPGDSRENPACE